MLELAGDADPLGGGPTRELAAGAEPVDDAERAVGVILARLLQEPNALREHRLERVDATLPNLNEGDAEGLNIVLADQD